jgi:transposase-like protein
MPRPNKGLAHVDSLDGDPETKWRLKVVLATLSGEMLVDEAVDELDVGPTQFANLRRQALQGALGALGPKPVGRPARTSEYGEDEVEALRQRIRELEHDAQLLRSRLELAVLPLLKETRRSKSRRAAPPARGPSGPVTPS